VWSLNARVLERRFTFTFEAVNARNFTDAEKSGLQFQFTFKDIFDKDYESDIYLMS